MGLLHEDYSLRESASSTQQALRSCFISSSATYIYKTEEADWSLALKMYFVRSVSVFFLVLVHIMKPLLVVFPLRTFILAGGCFTLQLSLMILRHSSGWHH